MHSLTVDVRWRYSVSKTQLEKSSGLQKQLHASQSCDRGLPSTQNNGNKAQLQGILQSLKREGNTLCNSPVRKKYLPHNWLVALQVREECLTRGRAKRSELLSLRRNGAQVISLILQYVIHCLSKHSLCLYTGAARARASLHYKGRDRKTYKTPRIHEL